MLKTNKKDRKMLKGGDDYGSNAFTRLLADSEDKQLKPLGSLDEKRLSSIESSNYGDGGFADRNTSTGFEKQASLDESYDYDGKHLLGKKIYADS